MLPLIFTFVIFIAVIAVTVSFFIRGFGGAGAQRAYFRGIGRGVMYVVRQVGRFVRWTLVNHWMFWLGVVVGSLATHFIAAHFR